MAGGAGVDVHLLHRGICFEDAAAGASDFGGAVFGMDVFLHNVNVPFPLGCRMTVVYDSGKIPDGRIPLFGSG